MAVHHTASPRVAVPLSLSRSMSPPRRALSLILALGGLLLCAQPALAVQGGYDEATSRLELGFKIVSTQRIGSDNECYPAPDQIAEVLRQEMGIEVVVAQNLESVQGFDLVNVVREGSECNRLVLAIRAGAKANVFVLDSDYGPVYAQGAEGLSEENQAAGIGPLRNLAAATGDIRMAEPDATARFEVTCPAGTTPLGGGTFNATPLPADGAGIYPHSYERLGVQGGFHVTSTLVDPSPGQPISQRGGIQVICGQGLVPTASPHATTYVRRHGTGTVTAHCPEGTQLFSGGFQRTNFTTPGVSHDGIFYGGDYITESRAVGTTGWRVSAGAADRDGGELTAIAYCAQDPSLPLSEVSASTTVDEGESGTVTAPRCPPGRALVAGGFSFGDSDDALFADGYFTRQGTWSATGYGWFGSADLTAYGYCVKVRDTVDRSDFPAQRVPPGTHDLEKGFPKALKYAGIGLAGVVLLGALLRLRARRKLRRRRHKRPR
jgi:hypothetical protein